MTPGPRRLEKKGKGDTMKIVVPDTYSLTRGDIDWGELGALGELFLYGDTPDEEVRDRIGDAEVALLNRTCLDREQIARCPNLRYIGLFATGYNMVDVDAARERGIPVTNVPGYSTMAVAQHTLALLLELCLRVGELDAGVKAGRWGTGEDSCFWDRPLVELAGLTMGLVGYGGIGRTVGGIARALGMRVVAARRTPSPREEEGVRFVPFERLLAEADVVSLHAPLNGETAGLINGASIERMRDAALLVNTARGGLVVEDEVARALHSGKLGGYATDVTVVEPTPAESPLLTAPNCIITPHIAWGPLATRKRLFGEVAANLRNWLNGKPTNVVNPL